MTSFRVRLALLVGLSTAAMLLAAAFLAWNFTSELNVERLERDLQHAARANLGRVASHQAERPTTSRISGSTVRKRWRSRMRS